MNFLSFNFLLSLLFFGFVGKTIWTFGQMFIAPTCKEGERCFSSYLIKHPKQDLCVFTSVRKNPKSNDISKVFEIKDFDYNDPSTRTMSIQIPYKTRNNGTLYLHVALGDSRERSWSWDEIRARSSVERIPLVVYNFPQAATFNLLESKDPDVKPKADERPVAHLKSSVTFSILSDPLTIPVSGVPGELVSYIRLTASDEYLPIIQYNFLKSRTRDLIEIKHNSDILNVTLDYSPASIGKMKLLVHISLALESLYSIGFSEKNVDEVKEIFADTNLYLICATTIISSFHLFFDFLAFKSDVSFWKGKKSMAGLSFRTVLWRAFSQAIVTLYLFDENTSLLILIPCIVGTLIELWKVKKMLHIDFDWKEKKFLKIVTDKVNKAELQTRAVDAEAMRYLSYVLYPLCICGAVYSLLYEPHKSWYSWTLHSMVNGVYAFGFLFMLPQLFINYKLKSVAALPWRSFMYKAFNTFIDDVFAFIITMPVAHRVACFRDDIVFLIYLYQRWLYPVDKSRIDDSVSMEETVDEVHEKTE